MITLLLDPVFISVLHLTLLEHNLCFFFFKQASMFFCEPVIIGKEFLTVRKSTCAICECLTLISRSYLVRQIRVGEHWAVKLTLITDKEKSDFLSDPRKIHFIGNIPLKSSISPNFIGRKGDYKFCYRIDSVQAYKRIMARAGIYPGPTCQILNLLYSFPLLYDDSCFIPTHQGNRRGK